MKKMAIYLLFSIFLLSTIAKWCNCYSQSNFIIKNIVDDDKDEKKGDDDFSKDKMGHSLQPFISLFTTRQQLHVIIIPSYVNPLGKIEIIPPEIVFIS
jgi:hypothetical protein